MVAKNLVTPLILLSLAVVVVLVVVCALYLQLFHSANVVPHLDLSCLVAVAVDDNLLYVVYWGQET